MTAKPGRVDAQVLPCATCPWRVDQDASVIPGYDHGKACGLTGTTGREDGFRPVMACHGSAEKYPRACRGYLAREGWRNLNVRMFLLRGQIENPSEVLAACRRHGVGLEPDYETVLTKLDNTRH